MTKVRLSPCRPIRSACTARPSRRATACWKPPSTMSTLGGV